MIYKHILVPPFPISWWLNIGFVHTFLEEMDERQMYLFSSNSNFEKQKNLFGMKPNTLTHLRLNIFHIISTVWICFRITDITFQCEAFPLKQK